ncbi:hypothetical protein BX600DRAFT_141505 [Xylariales sp. PMI_506]|nr:hypothetical protein BX600DRAFT_141505 [Xylariales sp. PMI_506]
MSNSRIVRFPISGKEDTFYLVRVLSNGSKPLDIKLIGTENSSVYVAKLRHKRIDELKASAGHCTDDEWEQILLSTLVTPGSSGVRDRGIEIKAETKSDAVTLNFRKNIQGITQRLGSIKLEVVDIDDKREAETADQSDLFEWCVEAIGANAKVLEEIAAATAKADQLEKSVNELKSQLEDLIKAKEDDETQLLEKFRDLLNEKKLKIRQQQRLLESADIAPEDAENVKSSQGGGRKAKTSRGGKRKAVPEPAQDDSDDGFEHMDVDRDSAVKDEPEDEGRRMDDIEERQTTEDETESEAEESEEDSPPPPPKTRGRGKGKGKATVSPPPRAARGRKAVSAEEQEVKSPPPKRALPFNNRQQVTRQQDNDETESDEEL